MLKKKKKKKNTCAFLVVTYSLTHSSFVSLGHKTLKVAPPPQKKKNNNNNNTKSPTHVNNKLDHRDLHCTHLSTVSVCTSLCCPRASQFRCHSLIWWTSGSHQSLGCTRRRNFDNGRSRVVGRAHSRVAGKWAGLGQSRTQTGKKEQTNK